MQRIRNKALGSAITLSVLTLGTLSSNVQGQEYSSCTYDLSGDGTNLVYTYTTGPDTITSTTTYGTSENGGLPGIPQEIVYSNGTKTVNTNGGCLQSSFR